MKVPLLDLRAQNGPLREEILAAIERVVDSQQFILGPEVTALEEELSELLGIEYIIAVSSGTDAILVALMALDIRAGDEVITSAYSFFATAGGIVRLGARPVFVDINPTTFNLDVAGVRAAITPRTRAILPVHLFGLSADLDPVLATAREADVPVVEDAAQAIGATYHSRPVGGIGAVGCFSFYPSKNLGAFGEAGLLATNDAVLARRARVLRSHGMEPNYFHAMVGGNFRMDALQAAVLRVKARHLERWTEARRCNAGRYERLFRTAELTDRVRLPVELPGTRHIFNQYVIRVPERDALKRHLDGRGIGNEIYYPLPLHLQHCFANLGYRAGDFPNAEDAAADSLAIPVYSEITPEQQQMVVDQIAVFLGSLDNRSS